VEYATAYRKLISASSDGNGSVPFSWQRVDGPGLKDKDIYNYLHTIRTTPLIARVHWLFSHRTQEIIATPPSIPKTYKLQLLITPVVTLWNPYNATIPMTGGGMLLRMAKSPPCALIYYKGDGVTAMPGRKLTTGTGTAGQDSAVANYPDKFFNYGSMEYSFTDTNPLLPGETRVYSPVNVTSNATCAMKVGYNPNGGYIADIGFVGKLEQGNKVKLDLKFDNLININGPGSGVFLDVLQANNSSGIYMRYLMTVTQATAQQQWPEITSDKLPSPQVQDIAGNTWYPFFSTVFGPRVTSDSSMPGKGFVQSSPLVSHTNMRPSNTNPGANHPANSAFTYSFFPHTLGGDTTLPNANNATNRGYIVSGFSAADGLSRMILNELPLRPLCSLAELQNWDVRAHNPFPPFQLYVIGNSDASPLIAANSVKTGTALQHDDSYCANHLLFDDWFFSSIAPEPANFGNSISKDIRTRYKEFLDGDKPLTNRSYRRILADQKLTASERDAILNDMLDSTDGWQRVASRLETEGMFNVNSTSVTAWRALLGHCRDQKIPYYAEPGITLSGKTDHVLSRFAVAGDVQDGKPGMAGAFPEASEFSGYRVFTEPMLDALAGKIVEQIRLRGPFLSLSEFVNRQLSSGDLALAGTIQTALNQISADAATDPFKVLKSQALSEDTNPDDPKVAGAGYQFKAAAVGKSSYGVPGWIRQADILRPLAPILSARDDTFTIRAYGDARDKDGKVIAKAWCEATVTRTRDFVDPTDAADLVTAPTLEANRTFGRRYRIESFRWLSPDEV
jgi:hypothetical protein